jgi:hypothetical protein
VIVAALDELDIAAALAAFRDQGETHGHTAEADADRSIAYFRGELIRRAQETDVALPGERQNLAVAYLRAAKLAAFAIAFMRRIRLEQRACNMAAKP